MDITGLAHVAFGVAALALGAAVLLLEKGTNRHRTAGMLYIFSMFGLNITAMLIYRIFGGFGLFHILAILTLVQVLIGLFAVMLHRPRQAWLRVHYFTITWSYVGLLAATTTEIAVRVFHAGFWTVVLIPTIATAIIGGALVSLLARRTMAGVKITH